MKITVNTFGSRGDIQPFIALSLGLKQAGHSVRVLTHQIFESIVRAGGLEFYPLPLDPRQVLVNQAVAELGNNPFKTFRWMQVNLKSAASEIFQSTLEANRDAEVMLNAGLSIAGWHVAEKLGIPAIAVYLWPTTPSRYQVGALGKIPPEHLPFKGLVNYYSTKLSNQLFFNLMMPTANHYRRNLLGLKPMTLRGYWDIDSPNYPVHILYGYSPSVVPKPPDWSDYQQITGYWFMDTDQAFQPEKGLLDFIERGSKPVYIGFGSMVDHNRDETNKAIVDALRATGQRGVLLGGWSELGSDLPDFMYRVDEVPHDWLFPRMAAVVHHGGAGTTAAGLRAGVPSVIVPWFGDQFFWGWRLHKLGIGVKPIPRNKLTAARLATAIQQAVTDEQMKHRASLLCMKIRTENGVENAVRLIETIV